MVNNRYTLLQINFNVNPLICCFGTNFVHSSGFLRNWIIYTNTATFICSRMASLTLNSKWFTFYIKIYAIMNRKKVGFRVSKLEIDFSKNVLFISFNIVSLLTVFCLSWYQHFKYVLLSLAFGDKIASVLGFHISNHCPEILKVQSCFQTP